MDKRVIYIALLAASSGIYSCKNTQSQNHGAIVLGDSSTIVTEKDPQRLQDLVTDLKPTIQPAETKDTAVAQAPPKAPENKPAQPAAATPPKQNATVPAGAGLTIDFKVASVLIPNVVAKQSGNPNLEHANGATYMWTSGSINNNLLKVSPNITKVSQRYQTVIVLKNELGVLPLESLTTLVAWTPLKGVNNVYRITGLDERSLDYSEAGRSEIRNAVSKSARRHRMSRRRVRDWENSVRNARATNQKPLYVVLRSVMWKIDGKDANGKFFSKQIRIDMPL